MNTKNRNAFAATLILMGFKITTKGTDNIILRKEIKYTIRKQTESIIRTYDITAIAKAGSVTAYGSGRTMTFKKYLEYLADDDYAKIMTRSI